MCADCHSTGLRRNYDAATGAYHTQFAEIDVACESCHGPGARHASWARKDAGWRDADATKGLAVPLEERKGVSWALNAETGNSARSAPRTTTHEIETCALCHSRRGPIWAEVGPGAPIGDSYRVALLDDDLYFPDGQIRDEVYEYGSFLQSRMFHAGVTCSDCHEPHSLELRASGNGVCLQCHSPDKYRSRRSPASRARHARVEMRLVPHADAHLYGCRSPARSQPAHPPSRSQREAGRAERLQQLPRRQVAAMGGGADQVLARFAGPGLSAFRSKRCRPARSALPARARV